MWPSYLGVSTVLLLSCSPGKPLQPFQVKGKTSNASAQPLGNEVIPVPADTRTPPPDDPLEEEKAVEPAVIGGAYLVCAADAENSLVTLNVGCRVGNVAEADWMAAEKNLFVLNNLNDVLAASPVSIVPEKGEYPMQFEAERSLQNFLELHMDVKLPQGRLVMSTTVSPELPKSSPQSATGLTLYASTGVNGNWPGVDRKTWNLWMPIEIPQFITNINPDRSNQGPGSADDSAGLNQVELVYDETVCTYEILTDDERNAAIKGARPEDFIFKSCTRNWKPAQWVRVKALSLRLKTPGVPASYAASVILRTEP